MTGEARVVKYLWWLFHTLLPYASVTNSWMLIKLGNKWMSQTWYLVPSLGSAYGHHTQDKGSNNPLPVVNILQDRHMSPEIQTKNDERCKVNHFLHRNDVLSLMVQSHELLKRRKPGCMSCREWWPYYVNVTLDHITRQTNPTWTCLYFYCIWPIIWQ